MTIDRDVFEGLCHKVRDSSSGHGLSRYSKHSYGVDTTPQRSLEQARINYMLSQLDHGDARRILVSRIQQDVERLRDEHRRNP